ncbi:MAG TPA: bifunctional phosphoribosylaminoimidazolecarboxamide formyltransferase/IMP cyclohydrolase [Thermoanaerobaculia bacterium]|jgi:phosphoribosylaminoimidazolecarboxamide formyltransferase/IMP cyclohydrolase|nr:bifunctional phosphoribosylaminoimidazolecarboxamide formyltransferase/IMP cyclohydrolase [Thermoanaerobaculia bacterium]
MLPAKRALLSVSDKTSLEAFARGLVALGIEIVSTGGTAKALAEAGLPVTTVSEVTGFPEILDGRVKTLHPKVHGGILADRNKAAHLAALDAHGITRIDLVAVNLYPFRETVKDPATTLAAGIEQIDVGGPTMVRAAAKNFAGVVVVVDPGDYPAVLAALQAGGRVVPEALRFQLAAKAFAHTQAYDAAIASWLAARTSSGAGGGAADAAPATSAHDASTDTGTTFPPHLELALTCELTPRYGENPHQPAAVYRDDRGPGLLGGMRQLQGKQLSWNNVLDADAARRLVWLFAEPTVVIVKHNNPCGVGMGSTLVEAYERALACDPVSAFGSIVATNRDADAAFVEAMSKLFVEVLVAPGYAADAAQLLARKENLRALACPAHAFRPGALELRAVDGGYLAQEPDDAPEDAAAWTCPTKRQPTAAERTALELAWKVCRHVKSNAIVLANEKQSVGIGAGQMSRVDSCRLAVEKAQLPVRGSVAASDAFFPFRDGLDVLATAGVTAVVQPGGSKRDDEVVAAADEQGLAMLLTGRRHFKH